MKYMNRVVGALLISAVPVTAFAKDLRCQSYELTVTDTIADEGTVPQAKLRYQVSEASLWGKRLPLPLKSSSGEVDVFGPLPESTLMASVEFATSRGWRISVFYDADQQKMNYTAELGSRQDPIQISADGASDRSQLGFTIGKTSAYISCELVES